MNKKGILITITGIVIAFGIGTFFGKTMLYNEKKVSDGSKEQEQAEVNDNDEDENNSVDNNVVSIAEEVSGFRVMTVGTGNPNLDVNRGGASTLVQYKDKYFLVDCGANACLTLMNNGLHPSKIDNMLFTHQHNDHNNDFWTFFVGGWGSPTVRRQLDLIGPGVEDLYTRTVDFYRIDLEYRSNGVGFSADGVLTNVDIKDLTEENYEFELDGVKITAIPVPHTIDTYAYKFEADGQSIVVTGDMTYTEDLAPLAKDCDILVIDAMLVGEMTDLPEQARNGMRKSLLKSHISSEEIGEIAAEAQPKKLVLTHLGGVVDLQATKDLYKEAGFKGDTIEAKDGMIINP